MNGFQNLILISSLVEIAFCTGQEKDTLSLQIWWNLLSYPNFENDCSIRLVTKVLNLIQNSPAVKKGCGFQKAMVKKRCEIQVGSQEILVNGKHFSNGNSGNCAISSKFY